MLIYSENRPSASRKAVALTFVALLSACGNGTSDLSNPINKSSITSSFAATATAIAIVTPAHYTVANIDQNFDIYIEKDKVFSSNRLNNIGQLTGYITLSGSDIFQAALYKDGKSTTLETPDNENNSSFGVAINDKGQVTGNRLIGDDSRAFLYDGAAMINLGTLNNSSGYSYANAINASGWVTGHSHNGRAAHAFLHKDNKMIDLGALKDENNNSYGIAINANGWVTGYSHNGKTDRAFLYNGNKMIDLGPLDNENHSSYAIAINANGWVTGYSYNGKANRAFLYNGIKMIDLGPFDNENHSSYATAINADGWVIGYSYNGETAHAFISDGTTMTDLGAFGGPSARSEASSINASGQVVGRSQAAGDVERAFIKSPGDTQMIDLNTRLTNAPGVELFDAVAISDSGYILARANTGWVLLKPASSMPEPTPATLGAITANDPVAVGTPVNVSVQFSDINTNETHTAVWTWEGNGTSPGAVTEPNGTVPGTVTGSTIFSAAGLYDVTLKVTDGSIAPPSSVSRQIVVYDPSAGFVTGGGWIMSPAGAYKADERMTGRATFGFVSKYLKGANKPTGETEFRFQTSGLNFYSNNYDWLVVGGARAQYKGTGTINGKAGYQFMLTAVDGDLIAKGTPDRFRIKIWHHDDSTNTDVTDYDNQIDSNVAGSDPEGTVVGGGSINVKIR